MTNARVDRLPLGNVKIILRKRRTIMKKIITMALSLVLVLGISIGFTGCGDGGTTGQNGEVYVYNFGDYIDTDLIAQFESETGIKVVYDVYDTNEEMYPVIEANSAQYDVICPSDYMVEKMIKNDLLAEIDYDNIPNIKYIGEEYLAMVDGYDPGHKYSVPHTWGTAGIMYNTAKIEKGSITSWKDLWDKKYEGTIVMQDSLRDTIMVGEKALGYSLNTTSEKELKAATDYLIKQKPLVYKYVNDSARDLLINESADIGVVWNGEVLYSQELNPNLDFVVPKEGSELFVDAWAIPKTAANKANAEAWINFMCRPEVAYQNFEYLTYSTPNTGAIEMMDEETRNNGALFPSKDVMARCEVLKSLTPEQDDMYSKYWKIFKSK